MRSLKRPASIIVFTVLLIITPLITTIVNAYINLIPLWGVGGIFSRMLPSDIVMLFVYPVAAFSVYSVRKIGWWIFIASALSILIYNTVAYIRNPMITLLGLILFNLAVLAVTAVFFRKHIIAPYFNPRLRWWEQARRWDINLGVALEYGDSYEIGHLEDISVGGCFIRITETISVGKTYPLKLSLGNEMSMSIRGMVMRAVADDCSIPGYGIMFVHASDTEKEGLESMLSALHSLGLGERADSAAEDKRKFERYSVNLSVSFRYNGEILPARLINFSSTGACLETMLDMQMGEFCGFYCTIGYNSADVDGVIKWKKKLEHHRHYGISFINPTKKQRTDISQILGTVKALGGKRRSRDMDAYDKLVERTLPGTPYRVFQRVRKK